MDLLPSTLEVFITINHINSRIDIATVTLLALLIPLGSMEVILCEGHLISWCQPLFFTLIHLEHGSFGIVQWSFAVLLLHKQDLVLQFLILLVANIITCHIVLTLHVTAWLIYLRQIPILLQLVTPVLWLLVLDQVLQWYKARFVWLGYSIASWTTHFFSGVIWTTVLLKLVDVGGVVCLVWSWLLACLCRGLVLGGWVEKWLRWPWTCIVKSEVLLSVVRDASVRERDVVLDYLVRVWVAWVLVVVHLWHGHLGHVHLHG